MAPRRSTTWCPAGLASLGNGPTDSCDADDEIGPAVPLPPEWAGERRPRAFPISSSPRKAACGAGVRPACPAPQNPACDLFALIAFPMRRRAPAARQGADAPTFVPAPSFRSRRAGLLGDRARAACRPGPARSKFSSGPARSPSFSGGERAPLVRRLGYSYIQPLIAPPTPDDGEVRVAMPPIGVNPRSHSSPPSVFGVHRRAPKL